MSAACIEAVAPPVTVSQPGDRIQDLKKALSVNLAQSTKRIEVGRYNPVEMVKAIKVRLFRL